MLYSKLIGTIHVQNPVTTHPKQKKRTFNHTPQPALLQRFYSVAERPSVLSLLNIFTNTSLLSSFYLRLQVMPISTNIDSVW